jgi:serine/threonine protein kinase
MRICCNTQHDDGARVCRSCGKALTHAPRLRDPGETVNGYTVEALIGRGGFGAVYRARGMVDGRAATVALKETLHANAFAPMEREFAVLSALQRRSTAAEYAHLPRYHTMFEAEGFVYLVMEYVAGLHLGEVCAQYPGTRLPAAVALTYALQVCAALEVLHRQDPPIYHRDIKPQHIRLTPSGQIKLVGFGLLQTGDGPTAQSVRGGTFAYSPPEQLSDGPCMTDARSDIYSLAATIHVLVTGELPASAMARVSAIVDPLRAAHEVCGDVPEALGRALLACMALQKEQRPPDVASVRQLLTGLSVTPPHAPALGPGSVLVGPADRYRIVERVGGGGFGTVWRAERRDGRPVAIKSTRRIEDARRFEAEAGVLHRLMHDNLPRYYEAWIDASGNGYLAMEFVPGEDMAAILERQGALTVADAKRVALQVCNVLELLHQQVPPIYHQDIKPANIRRTPEGLIKLVDFGSMKAGDGRAESGLRGAVTPMFAPIEQADRTRATDARSDVYSLAATLYSLVHARPPSLAVARQGRTPDPLVPPNTGDARFDAALLRGMAVEPADRPASVMAFRALIDDGCFDDSTVTVPRSADASRAGAPTSSMPLRSWSDDTTVRPERTPPPVMHRITTPLLAQTPNVPQVRPPPPVLPEKRDTAGAVYLWVPAGGGLPGFWMMRTPVTNAMWRAAVQAGAVPEPRRTAAYHDAAKAQHPVVYVRRAQARAYAAWVGGRLPRDAEWTRAAQGDDGRTYPWGDTPPDATQANCRPHGPGETTPVGAYPAGAGPYGLLDMAGNVWEWVDPDGGGDRPYIIRGGAFHGFPGSVVCGARHEVGEGAGSLVGFRVVSPDA